MLHLDICILCLAAVSGDMLLHIIRLPVDSLPRALYLFQLRTNPENHTVGQILQEFVHVVAVGNRWICKA